MVGMYSMRAAFRLRAYSTLGAGSENAYKILGLQRNCSAESVRSAFRELAKATHPDKQQPGISGSASSAHFVRVLAAYQILADPRKRALYDAQLGAQEKRQQRKEEFYQHYRRTEYAAKRTKADFDRGFDSSDADPSAGIHEPERQEFVCPDTEVVKWLRHYRSAVTSAVHRREIGVGGGLLEGVRGELGSALRKAYHGPPVYEEKGIPNCFEADERAEPHVGSDILQLVSGHNLFGFVRVPRHSMLESSELHIKASDGTTGNTREYSYANSSDHYNFGHVGHSHSMQSPGNETVESEYVDLELHVFGKVIARASRVQPEVDDSSLKSSDCIYVYSALPSSEENRQTLKSSSDLVGTIHGLGDVSPQVVCAVHGPDGQLTHRIVQHHSPLVG